MRRVILLTVLALGPTAARAEKGLLYVGAGVTNSSLSVNVSEPGADLNNHAGKGFVGVRPFNYLAVEADYIDLGSGSGSTMHDSCFCTAHADSSAWAGYAVGLIPVTVVDFFAKMGVARWKLKNVNEGGSVTFYRPPIITNNYSGYDFAYGIGVQAHFSVVGVRLEYEGVKVYNNEANIASLSVFVNLF